MAGHRSLRYAGVFFGMWLAWLYAFFNDEINRIELPGIPLPAPEGGFLGYYLGAIVVGALIGLACTWPGNNWLGGVLGGLVGTVLAFVAPWKQIGLTPAQTVGTIVLTITTFLPMVVILAPFALLARLAANHLVEHSGLSLERIGLPVLVSVLAIVAGIWAMPSTDVRNALYASQNMLVRGMQSASRDQLPIPLKSVEGFIPNASGRYTLEWSDDVNQFQGPVPVNARPSSSFLIIARYENGFRLACFYPNGVSQPSCTNFR